MYKVVSSIVLFRFLLSFSACKNKIFLKRKYCSGWHYAFNKKSKPMGIYCSAEAKHQPTKFFNEVNYSVYQANVTNEEIFKETTKKISLAKTVKFPKNSAAINTTAKGNLEIVTPQKRSIFPKNKCIFPSKKTKDNKHSYLISILLFLGFWTLYVLIFSHNLAAQFSGYLLILQTLGYLALALLILAIIYLIASQLKK